MADSGQGPSNPKRPKFSELKFKNPKKLTDDELLAALMCVSDEDEDVFSDTDNLSDVDAHLQNGDSESEEEETDEEENPNEDNLGKIFNFLGY